MQASYTVMEYMGPAVCAGVGGLLLFLILGICIPRILIVRMKKVSAGWAVFLVLMCGLVLLGNRIVPAFNRLGDLLIPGEYVVRTTGGQIEAVTAQKANIGHFRDGTLLSGEEVCVDGEIYYVISEGLLTEGMYIEFQYAHFESNVILNWTEVSPERAAQVREEMRLEEPELPEETPEPEVSSRAKRIGAWLIRIGVFGFAAIAVLSGFFERKIVARIQMQDAAVKDGIRPNPFALMPFLLVFLCFVLIAVGTVINNGNYGFVLVFAIGGGCMILFAGGELSTSLKWDGSTFAIRRWGKESTCLLSDVHAIFWRRSRGMIGKSMVLVLKNGKSYWFSMDAFSGVENTFRYISACLEKACKEDAE